MAEQCPNGTQAHENYWHKQNIVELRGCGYDENALAMGAPLEAASFENYGIVLMIENDEIVRIQLNMFDRNISIVYL